MDKLMRGHVDPESRLFSYFSPEERVPAEHPLRSIKTYTESALKRIRPLLDGLYSDTLALGPSTPPTPTSQTNEGSWPSPPSEPGVQFSRDGLSSQLFPHD